MFIGTHEKASGRSGSHSGRDLFGEIAAQVPAGAADVLPKPVTGELDIAGHGTLGNFAVLDAHVPNMFEA